MKTNRLTFICLILTALFPVRVAPAEEATKTKTVRLLTGGNSFSQNATRFLSELAKADGNVLVHETWEYRRDDPRFAVKTPKPGEPATQAAMYEGLSSAYKTIAAELGARRIPVGDAFHLADSDPKWGYQPDTKFDLKNAKAPA